MIEFAGPLTLLLFVNSFVSTVLILNQNESTKDSTSSQTNSAENPLEKFTLGCLILQLFLLLLKTKITDF